MTPFSSLPHQHHAPLTPSATALESALAAIQASDREWLAAVALNGHQQPLGEAYPVRVGSACPLIELSLDTIFEHAIALKARMIVTIRHHPHQGFPPMYKYYHGLRRLLSAAILAGVPLYDHLSLYQGQAPFSFRALSRLVLLVFGGLTGAEQLITHFDYMAEI
jgi:DNA repair protein RadC